MNSAKISDNTKNIVYSETGLPSGLYPLITGYDNLPVNNIDFIEFPEGFIRFYKNIERVDINYVDNIKKNLKEDFESGLNKTIKNVSYGINNTEISEETTESYIPAETYIEELSTKYKVHPVSIFWLIEEGISKDGWSYFNEIDKPLKDKISITILNLFGHRWPKQVESGDNSPEATNNDGIIPIISTGGSKAIIDYIDEQIKRFGSEDIELIKKMFIETTNINFEKWLIETFFEYHTTQFKNRPIIWQLESTPVSQSNRRYGTPAFSCLIYYHRLNADSLPKIRSQYVEPLINRYETELRTIEASSLTGDQNARKLQLENWINELKEFDIKLGLVLAYGFSQLPFSEWGKEGVTDVDPLKQRLSKETIDRWTSLDVHVTKPSNLEEFYSQESRYDPNINDGVRVNIAPLQKAGLLAVDVLAKKDVDKAIADRAEWRADERRWCREGKLSRPGWWKEETKQ
ncbi:hypothetical protein [Methanocella sp. MCL-LM]|uniref:hypothetical protein n=1 Tax=Methanocella sp. MCL-LM TaxID=3412035 RepID=UPI003C746F17